LKPWFLVWHRLPANGMAIFPFIIVREAHMKTDPVLVNHERIHFRQQLELLILPFYLLYFLNYLINLLRYRNHSLAYFNLVFEKEAYACAHNLDYLKKRKFFAWKKYV
jgi:hypothetical protein